MRFCRLFLRDNGFDYLEFRLWIGLWSGLFCLVLVATDASFLVQYFTRFTEEGFSALISFIFIYDAFKKMIKLGHYNPINTQYDPNLVTQYDCRCAPGTLASLNKDKVSLLCRDECFCGYVHTCVHYSFRLLLPVFTAAQLMMLACR